MTIRNSLSDVLSTAARRLAGAAGLALMAAGIALAPPAVQAQEDTAPTVDIAELMKAGALPEIAIGPADAKVTIVEYFSQTCPHCAQFATKIYPEIKKKYVDPGKVRFVFREFPHNNRAYAASMLTRCVPEDKAITMIEVLFETQQDWAFKPDKTSFETALLDVAKQAGFTQETFYKCLSDSKLLENISAVHRRAQENFGISRIPTIFVNGKKIVGEATLEAVEKAIEPLLPKS